MMVLDGYKADFFVEIGRQRVQNIVFRSFTINFQEVAERNIVVGVPLCE